MEIKKGADFVKEFFDVTGKVAIITGATGGFGNTAARALAVAGVKVMATGRSEEKLKPLVEEIEKEGGVAAYEAGSPIEQEDVQKVVKKTVDQFGGIDILITAAGVNKPGAIVEQTLEEWDMIMDANVKGTWLCCQAIAPLMVKQSAGKIINIASHVMRVPDANIFLPYALSKGAIYTLTQALARALGPSGINVNAIGPGLVATEASLAKDGIEKTFENVVAAQSIKRRQEPEDVVGTVLFLASKESDFISGQLIIVDGGSVML